MAEFGVWRVGIAMFATAVLTATVMSPVQALETEAPDDGLGEILAALPSTAAELPDAEAPTGVYEFTARIPELL